MLSLVERVRDWWYARRRRQIGPENARDRVQRGAEYLDRMDPDWYRRVDSTTLELADGRHCVLGQLHGEFRLGLGRSRLINLSSAPRTSLSPVSYGFTCVEGVSEEWQAYDYELLNRAWRDAVRRRQEEPVDETSDPVGSASGDSLPRTPADPEPARTSSA